MQVDVNCAKCGAKITTMKMLKSIKDVLKHYNNKCPTCGKSLSTSDFVVDN